MSKPADKSVIRPELRLDPADEQDAAVLAFIDSLPHGAIGAVIKALLAHVITQSSKVELAAIVGQTILNGRGSRRKSPRTRTVATSRRAENVQESGSRVQEKIDAVVVSDSQSEVMQTAPQASGQEVSSKTPKALFGGMTAGTKF